MSLDSLFHHILVTEQKAEEKRRLMHQVKQEISLNHQKVKQTTEHLDEAKRKLEAEVQLLSEKLLNVELLKKREESLEKQKAELLSQKSTLLETLMDTKSKMAIEEQNLLKELTDFNNEYGLTCNRKLLIEKRVKTEIHELEEKENVLRNEMESMEHENAQSKIFQQKQNELKQDLFTLQRKHKDLEEEIREAKSITKCLETEKIRISEKPQTDAEYVRLKEELESYRKDEMENIYEGLQTEIEDLQMKLFPKNLQSNK